MLTGLANKTVTVLHPTLTEDHGNQVADWTSPTETPVPNCDVQPATTDEIQAHRDTVIIEKIAWLPLGTDLLAIDRIRYKGVDYDVHGQPQDWESASGSLDHLEVLLKRVEG